MTMRTLPEQLRQIRSAALFIGLAGLALCALGAALNPRQTSISYLFAFTFWIGLSLGCLTVAMIHHLTGGHWGFLVRRTFEAGFMTIPLMALLFVPLCFGVRELYPWNDPEIVASSEILQHKERYLNLPGFLIRAAACFVLWIILTRRLRHFSLAQDNSTDPAPTVRLRTFSGPGLVFHVLLGTFAFIDWVMSIEPEWHSSMFPVIVIIGQILSAITLGTIVLARFQSCPPFLLATSSKHFHDLGNLLLAFVMFWTYVSFSQLLIIYSGDLPSEIQWYRNRSTGSWIALTWILVAIHFFAPFALLLFRAIKRHPTCLSAVAILLFLAQILGVFWLIAPTFHPSGVNIHWLDLAALAGLGGLWTAWFATELNARPLLPQNDPRFDHTLAATANAR